MTNAKILQYAINCALFNGSNEERYMAPRDRTAATARRVGAQSAPHLSMSYVDNIQPEFLNAEAGFEKLRSDEVEVLRTLSGLAKAVAAQHLEGDNFRHLVKFAYDRRIVSAERLGEIGRVDPTTASRWINGRSTPSALAQEAILLRIAEEAAAQAARLRKAGQ
jgi:hypothetical protein